MDQKDVLNCFATLILELGTSTDEYVQYYMNSMKTVVDSGGLPTKWSLIY